MLLDFESFIRAGEEVRRIMTMDGDFSMDELDDLINTAVNNIDEGMLRDYYKQLNSHLLNIYLNQYNEYSPDRIQRSLDLRRIISDRLIAL